MTLFILATMPVEAYEDERGLWSLAGSYSKGTIDWHRLPLCHDGEDY
ncbi:hypothetical protein [Methylobacterium nigriterrae]